MFDTMQRVQELADARGLTLYQLSILSKISYNALKLTETRGGQLKVETIECICKGLRITMSEFFADAEQRAAS